MKAWAIGTFLVLAAAVSFTWIPAEAKPVPEILVKNREWLLSHGFNYETMGWCELYEDYYKDENGTLQDALDAGEKIILVEPRTFDIDEEITITNSGVVLLGSGMQASTLNWESNTNGLLIGNNSTPIHNILIKNIRLDGDAEDQVYPDAAVKIDYNTTNVYIENVYTKWWETSVQFDDCSNCVARNCTFNHLSDDIIRCTSTGTNNSVVDCSMGWGEALVADIEGTHDLFTFEGNKIGWTIGGGIRVQHGTGTRIIANYFEEMGLDYSSSLHSNDIVLVQVGYSGQTSNYPNCVVCQSNFINGYQLNGYYEPPEEQYAHYGIRIYNGKGHVILANSIRYAWYWGIKIEQDVEDFWVGWNHYWGNGHSDPPFSVGHVQCLSTDGVLMTWNNTLGNMVTTTMIPAGGTSSTHTVGTTDTPYPAVYAKHLKLYNSSAQKWVWLTTYHNEADGSYTTPANSFVFSDLATGELDFYAKKWEINDETAGTSGTSHEEWEIN